MSDYAPHAISRARTAAFVVKLMQNSTKLTCSKQVGLY